MSLDQSHSSLINLKGDVQAQAAEDLHSLAFGT